MQSLLAAAFLTSLLPACVGAGRGAQLLQRGAITSELAPPGESFAADYEDDVMGGAPTVDSIIRLWAGDECCSSVCMTFRLCQKPLVVVSVVYRCWLC